MAGAANLTRARERMVEIQLARRGIRSPAVLDAMRSVPRERFVQPGMEEFAYEDGPLPIPEGQTISQPFIVALMIEAAALGPHDRVLEVGAGSGYAAAVIGRIAKEVFAVERHPALAEAAGGIGVRQRLGKGRRRHAGLAGRSTLRRDHRFGGRAGRARSVEAAAENRRAAGHSGRRAGGRPDSEKIHAPSRGRLGRGGPLRRLLRAADRGGGLERRHARLAGKGAEQVARVGRKRLRQGQAQMMFISRNGQFSRMRS